MRTVIPALGWPAVFYIGGGLPLVVAILMMVPLPESISYLVMRDPASPRAMAIVRKLDRTLAGKDIGLAADTETVVGVGLRTLFTQGRGTGTVLLWLIMFMAFGTTTIIVLLSPTLFRLSGLSLSTAALLVLLTISSA